VYFFFFFFFFFVCLIYINKKKMSNAIVTQETERLKKQIAEAESVSDAAKLIGALDALAELKLDVRVLQATRVTATLRPLRRHADKDVSVRATALMGVWKEIVLAEASRTRAVQGKTPAAAAPDAAAITTEATSGADGAKDSPASSAAPAPDGGSTAMTGAAAGDETGDGATDDADGAADTTNTTNGEGDDAADTSAVPGAPGSPIFAPPKQLGRPDDQHRAAIYDKFVEYLGTEDPASGQSMSPPTSPSAAGGVSEFLTPIEDVAAEIEDALFGEYGGTNRDYMSKFRALGSSIRGNPALRRALRIGSIAPRKLHTLPPQDLATDEVRRRIEAARKADMDLAQQNVIRKKNQRVSKVFKCGKCGKRETTFFQMQTRSADEPMTTFITCLNCNNRWKFC
jgi:transcription elongation factor S-II